MDIRLIRGGGRISEEVLRMNEMNRNRSLQGFGSQQSRQPAARLETWDRLDPKLLHQQGLAIFEFLRTSGIRLCQTQLYQLLMATLMMEELANSSMMVELANSPMMEELANSPMMEELANSPMMEASQKEKEKEH